MTKERMLKFDALVALQGLNDVIENPETENFLTVTEEMQLKEARAICDKLVTELKKQEKDLKA